MSENKGKTKTNQKICQILHMVRKEKQLKSAAAAHKNKAVCWKSLWTLAPCLASCLKSACCSCRRALWRIKQTRDVAYTEEVKPSLDPKHENRTLSRQLLEQKAHLSSTCLLDAFFFSPPLANSTDGEEKSRRLKLVHYVGTES